MSHNIHPTAIIHPNAKIADNVTVGAFTQIGELVSIGENSKIGSNCEIGLEQGTLDPTELIIGKNANIRSGAILYLSSTFGDGFQTGHRVTIREGTIAGAGFQAGTLCDIQGHVEIGDHVKLHSNVHIGQGSKISSYVWIFPYVVLTNDPHPPSETRLGVTVKPYVAIGTMSTILPGVVIEEGCLIAAGSTLSKNTDADTIWAGTPAKSVGKTERIKLTGTDTPAYPWRRHFHRGYPDDIVQQWTKEFSA